ncbi:hypothetical protein BJY04DRAFT_212703 [Aspergillus karnatakaensis]|uniref:uncharacterized protein n=1 Tax=Aspergillus karnatakaensis TaxID=1810916 RepID=UPI003CCDBCB6
MDLLAYAARKHADVGARLQSAISAKQEEESRRVINFDCESKNVWREVSVEYNKLSCSKQYDAAFDVISSVKASINSIVKQCGPLVNPRTRYNGLSVLRKIGETICLSNSVIGSEMRKEFGRNPALVVGMAAIIGAMKPEEREAIRRDESSEEALWPKLLELEKLAEDYCVFEDDDDEDFEDENATEIPDGPHEDPLSGAKPLW